jgi:hypothetical protein
MRTRHNLTSRTEKRFGYLPRPALGRRPWFAFLRRARMRRRFAFAMARERNRASGPRRPTAVRLTVADWRSPLLLLLRSRLDRLWGLSPCPGPFGVLLKARSVHGFGLRSMVGFVALDERGVVIRVGVLRPRRVVVCRNAAWFAEFPCDGGWPSLGSEALLDRLGPWPAH